MAILQQKLVTPSEGFTSKNNPILLNKRTREVLNDWLSHSEKKVETLMVLQHQDEVFHKRLYRTIDFRRTDLTMSLP